MELFAITSLWYLITPVYVCPLQAGINNDKECVKLMAQIDTGAVGTSISKEALNKMEKQLGYKLFPIGTTTVYGVNSGAVEVPAYRFNVMLENENKQRVMFKNVTMTNDEIGIYEDMKGKEHNLDILLGMDVLNQMDYVIDNQDKQAKITFYYPKNETQDFRPTKIVNKKNITGHKKLKGAKKISKKANYDVEIG